MLHDLALALGGMTVTELKARMPMDELLAWHSYIEVNGPINPTIRNDVAIARLGSVMSGIKMDKLMPWPKEPEKEITVDAVASTLMRAFAQNKKAK